MTNDPSKADDTPPETDKKPATPLRRAGQVGLSILNPFSDLGVIYRQGVKPTTEKLKLLWQLLTPASGKTQADPAGVNWAQAVERSGRTAEQLLTTYTRIRLAWWCVMVIAGGLAVVLSGMLLLASDLPSGTLLRALVTLLVLACVGALGFVQTLIASYRLWQLRERRVSEREGGTFKAFMAENQWWTLVLLLGGRRL